jgi:hypothetical protein
MDGRKRGVATLGLATMAALILVGCDRPPSRGTGTTAPTRSEALPPFPSQDAGNVPGQAPLIWVGGTLTDVTDRTVVVTEASGTEVTLKRLGQDATAFLRTRAGAWQRVTTTSSIETGQAACVETLLDGQNLLALRVFLGAACGPTG